MKLRNKKNGKVYTACRVCFYESINDVEKRNWKTLKEFCEDWEDYTPKEPLIKDEKIRKAVRAWAEANDIGVVKLRQDKHRLLDRNVVIEFDTYFFEELQDGWNYPIAELCGEEEE